MEEKKGTRPPAYDLIGLEPNEENCVASMSVTERHINYAGIGLGGFTFMVGDAVMRFAANKVASRVVTGTATIKFLKPTKVGDKIMAEGKVRTIEGKKIFTQSDIFTEKEEERVLIASMEAVFIKIE